MAGVLPPVAEQPEAIRYRLLLDDLVARIQVQDREAALLARIERVAGEEAVTSSERAALEGAHAATEAIREALAEHDADSGLVWMFSMTEVSARAGAARPGARCARQRPERSERARRHIASARC